MITALSLRINEEKEKSFNVNVNVIINVADQQHSDSFAIEQIGTQTRFVFISKQII